MILITVGTQLPFDRLVQTADDYVAESRLAAFAQIGDGSFVPKHMDYCRSLSPDDFEERVRGCSVILSHAGIGSVLTAQRNRKPVIIFPRRQMFGEHRNDHQLATCTQLEGRPGIHVAWDHVQLIALLGQPLDFEQDEEIAARRSVFIENLKDYLDNPERLRSARKTRRGRFGALLGSPDAES